MGQIDRALNRVKVLKTKNFESKSAMSIALLSPPHTHMHKHTNVYIYIYIYIYIYTHEQKMRGCMILM